ncbi:hypothetical protein P153DRAFT_381106 [Dothidotthia symphoricarpi CBS 119687]|uniref:RING-type domain-containing protein n=1 Tax=Dothidotthia symphoricarpi CBS 119687 TaxID=1392245 RepID=A0A6A6ASK6_9PLEO|nr:uncharacterized protein P153DRAFT_381106 [Dothidotthia symphoricarpi CBS 119687]KAF2133934.1 hypothetical protein P153DRAFT_381106 [Dothidotthia symphoricarpi CBS 119687]
MSPATPKLKIQTAIRRCAFKVPSNAKYQCQKPGELMQLHLNIWYCRFHDRHAKDRCQAFAEWEGSGAYAQCTGLAKFVDHKTKKKVCGQHYTLKKEEEKKTKRREEERQKQTEEKERINGVERKEEMVTEQRPLKVAEEEQSNEVEVGQVDNTETEDGLAEVHKTEVTGEGRVEEKETHEDQEKDIETAIVEQDEDVDTEEETINELETKEEEARGEVESAEEETPKFVEAKTIEDPKTKEVETVEIDEAMNEEIEDTQTEVVEDAGVADPERTKTTESETNSHEATTELQEQEPCTSSATSTIPPSPAPSTPITESAPVVGPPLKIQTSFEKPTSPQKPTLSENQTLVSPRRSVFASRPLSFLLQSPNEESIFAGSKHIAAMYEQCNVCLEKHSVEYMRQVEPCKHRYLHACLKAAFRKGTFRRYNCTSCEAWITEVKKKHAET